MLSYDFLNMSLPKSRIMASIIMACYQNASHIHVTTELGTNLDFNIEGRVPGFFNGCCHDGKGLSSASVEVYVAPVESDTNGTLILDGSMGYIGIVDSPVRVELRGGRIVEIEDNASGRRLKQFLARYIEDESTYGTFHIGFGRNIALGGVQDASGHYDLVTHAPCIYVDNRMIMDHGQLTVLEPSIYI